MASETSPGGHLRIPESEVKRFKREGLPLIPRPLPIESSPPASNGNTGRHGYPELPAKVSQEVALAADRVAITRSMLEKRKIDREIEETEDWFRDRGHQKAAAEAVERQRVEAKLAEQRRQEWIQEWTQYALKSVPRDARGEVELEVHAAVDAALSNFRSCPPVAITRPLVDAAVWRALRPWTRKQGLETALKSAMSKLPWEVRVRSEHASLKQRAWDAAVESIRKLRDEATDHEMETATRLAVQPMIREYEHQHECERIVNRGYIFDATSEERDAAKDAVRKALAALPVGTTLRELEKAEEAALKPYKEAVTQRKATARWESEKQAKRRAAEWKVELQLDHIACYLAQEYEFDGGYAERSREAQRLRPLIRETVIDEFLKNPSMSDAAIRACIEEQIEDCF